MGGVFFLIFGGYRTPGACDRKVHNRRVHALCGNGVTPGVGRVERPSAAAARLGSVRTPCVPPWPIMGCLRRTAHWFAQFLVMTWYPPWATPRCVNVRGLGEIAEDDAQRVRQAIMSGRLRATKIKLREEVMRCGWVARRTPMDVLRGWIEGFEVDEVVSSLLPLWRRVCPRGPWDHLGAVANSLAKVVVSMAFPMFVDINMRLTLPLSCALTKTLATLHPVGQIIVRAFLAEYARIPGPPTEPLLALLEKGPGFIPTPTKAEAVFEMAVAFIAAAYNSKVPLSQDERACFFGKGILLARRVGLLQNLGEPMREALREVRRQASFVFVQTDKTGRVMRVPRDIMSFAVEASIRSKRGSGGFDLFDDPVAFARQLIEVKDKITQAADSFEEHGRRWKERWVGVDPFLALQKPLAWTLMESIRSAASYAPSFGPLKPLIKDHKMKESLEEWLDKWSFQKPSILPLRLVHKATVGPSQPVAVLVAPVLEALAACCSCALGQAAGDVVDFFAKRTFSYKPALAVMDVTDAFWRMQEGTILRRTKRVAVDNPKVLEFFNVAWETLEVAVRLVLQDNFFVAPAFSCVALYGRFTGCTMGNVVSKALCEIYYFGAFREALQTCPFLSIVYVRAGGDDSVIVARCDEDIQLLHSHMELADDHWKFELKLMGADDCLSFFDVSLRRVFSPDVQGWVIQTGVFFKPSDALMRTHAGSFWGKTHQEALLRAHVLRVAKFCSEQGLVSDAAQKVGILLARRLHPLDSLMNSLQVLGPCFLVDNMPERDRVEVGTTFLEPWYRAWMPHKRGPVTKLVFKVPFLGGWTNSVKEAVL